jgi:CheY-like chemotaxis protein
VKRILVAEDNPADVYLLREALSQHPAQVELVVVVDGEEALDYIDKRGRFSDAPKPDLFVLDLNLPKSDGNDVLRRIREKPELNSIPVVVLTSSDSPRDRNVAASLGAASFLTKPSDLDQFLALGGKLLEFIGIPSNRSAATRS